jgi:carboxylesterase type B
VTVSGQSAGAASAHMHLFSPLSQGLFRSIMPFSGSAMNFWANRVTDDHLVYARKQAEQVGWSNFDIDFLTFPFLLV